MTMLLSIFGVLGRFAGDLLTSALSWASSLLFGRVPRSHQIFLVLMMAGSFLWLLVGLGLLVPGIASWFFDATPHPPFIDRAWLGSGARRGPRAAPAGRRAGGLPRTRR